MILRNIFLQTNTKYLPFFASFVAEFVENLHTVLFFRITDQEGPILTINTSNRYSFYKRYDRVFSNLMTLITTCHKFETILLTSEYELYWLLKF